MRIFRPEFKDRHSGEKKVAIKFYADFVDHRRIRRRIPTERCATLRQAERFGEMLDALVTARQYGQMPERNVIDWLHGLSSRALKKLAEIDLIDPEMVTSSIPLEQHIADFEQWLKTTKAKHGYNRSDEYIHNTMQQIRVLLDDFGFWADITKGEVENRLGRLNVASKTFNGYQAAVKMFGDWMVENGRAVESPVKRIKALRVDKTEKRRALTVEEAIALLRATALGPTLHGVSGTDRAVLYLLALETGYRLKELRSLTVDCFDLDNNCVSLDGRFTKNHEPADQLIKASRSRQYRVFLAGRTGRVFTLPHANEVLDDLRRDLTAAGIKLVDAKGVKVVFHSLRYGLATMLDRTGATMKERMVIMRHSDKGFLTLGVYTTLQVLDLRGAIERLPDLPWPLDIRAQGTEPMKGVAG